MNKNILILFFLTLNISAFGQLTFEKVFSYAGPGWIHTTETFDHGFILVDCQTIIKLDLNGDTLWTNNFSGITLYGFKQTSDSGIAAIGRTDSFGAGNVDFILLRLDKSGNITWTKTYGGGKDDYVMDIQQTFDGGFILCGITWSFNNMMDSLYSNSYVVKTDASGDTLWTKVFGGYGDDNAYSIIQTSDSNYTVLGSTNNFSGALEFFLCRFDQNGNSIWKRTMGGTNNEHGSQLMQTSDGGYILTGNTWSFGVSNNDNYIVKADSSGNPVWSRTFGTAPNDGAGGIIQTPDSGYLLINYSFPGDTSDVIRINSNGDTLWTKSFHADLNDIELTSDGGIILGGTIVLGIYQAYLIKTGIDANSCSSFNSTIQISTPNTQISPMGQQYELSGAQITSPVVGTTSGILVGTICISTRIKEHLENKSILIFPNPALEKINIISKSYGIQSIEILNVSGEIIFSENYSLKKNSTEVAVRDWGKGFYFVKVQTEKGSSVQKLIIQ